MSDQPPSGPQPGGYPPPGDQPPDGGHRKPGDNPQSGGYPQSDQYQQPGQYQQSGGYQQPGQYPPAAPQNTVGIVALVLAILALLTSWTIVGGVILGLLAVALGFVARSRYKKGTATNGTVALISIILGLIAAALSILLVVVGVGLFNRAGGTDLVDCLNQAGSSQRERQLCADQFQENIEDRYGVTIEPTP